MQVVIPYDSILQKQVQDVSSMDVDGAADMSGDDLSDETGSQVSDSDDEGVEVVPQVTRKVGRPIGAKNKVHQPVPALQRITRSMEPKSSSVFSA